ncbi:MAG: MMPL family transporter [Microscillaceae bacterium]|nr:MMPL family transporter [Microscillaceae bacterium]MDW8461781.1 MMPL family transporter [Cytophagales bacterium]
MSKILVFWEYLAIQILRFRLILLTFLLISTLFWLYQSRTVRLSYEHMKVVPSDDADMIYFRNFLQTFGEEGNLLAIGLKDNSVFQLPKFRALNQFTQKIEKIYGVKEVIALTHLQYLHKDTTAKVFRLKKVFEPMPQNQAQLDSLLQFAKALKVYEGQILSKEQALMIVLAIDKKVLDSPQRLELMQSIKQEGEKFSQATQIKLHYAGLPYTRTIMATLVRSELQMFLVISLLVTVAVVFLFFRSIVPVLVSIGLIAMAVISCMGIMGSLGYKITILSGIIPPILVVIAIPNLVYITTKFHQKFAILQDKVRALQKVLAEIGFVTLTANITTATGFFVFMIGDVTILKEFGLLTGLSVLYTMCISLIFIPIAYYYLPSPQTHTLKHLEHKGMNKIIDFLILLAHKYRTITLVCTLTVIVISFVGMSQLRPLAFMVDDLPESSDIKTDLAFFEKHFKGVMPLEIVVDTGKKKGAQKLKNLILIDSLEQYLASLPEVNRPISMVGFLKTANQAYFNNHTEYFRLPEKREMVFITSYLKGQKDDRNLVRNFIDKDEQRIRLSLKVADIGTQAMDKLVRQKIRPVIDSIFKGSELRADITGTSYLFVKGNDYLLSSLKMSILAAICFVALAHGILFFNLRMMLISILPNLIPMIITAGLMGFLGIPLKPSTVIIFSIVFGIAVDDTVHFLARYKLALTEYNNVLQATLLSLKETGHSMIYTSLVLFAGFFIFVSSQFGGTVALGVLTSTTLLVAMLTNLVVLPILLIFLDKNPHKAKGQ